MNRSFGPALWTSVIAMSLSAEQVVLFSYYCTGVGFPKSRSKPTGASGYVSDVLYFQFIFLHWPYHTSSARFGNVSSSIELL